MRCGKCCQDLSIPILHLLFPDAFLDEEGIEFYHAHGLSDLLRPNVNAEFDYKGVVFKISLLGLIRPDIWLDKDGQEFHKDYNLDELLRTNGVVKLIHRCQHLAQDNSCSIYPDRPQLCRSFDCTKRDDCSDVHPLEFRR